MVSVDATLWTSNIPYRHFIHSCKCTEKHWYKQVCNERVLKYSSNYYSLFLKKDAFRYLILFIVGVSIFLSLPVFKWMRTAFLCTNFFSLEHIFHIIKTAP